jgi:hypothetical protein
MDEKNNFPEYCYKFKFVVPSRRFRTYTFVAKTYIYTICENLKTIG